VALQYPKISYTRAVSVGCESTGSARELPAIIQQPGQGERLIYGDGDVSVVLAAGTATAGAFSVVEHQLAPGAVGPPLHKHERLVDAFYILEGTLTLQVDDRTVAASAGTFACFPPGVAHTFSNRSDDPVRVLNINAPGGWDDVLRALVPAAGGRAADQAETGRIAAARDMIVLE
jgi:mannose-6-phosphate isomerase-like protein (cupin superfamily)